MKSVARFALMGMLALICNLAWSQTITITSPNGGENLDGCTNRTISWTASGTSNSYSIDYSIDNGANWTSVASFFFTTTGTYSWTIPNVTSANCLIRVYDSNAPAIRDSSNAVFSINGPLTLLTPNGGENWVAGSQQAITWAASGTSNIYRLEYSTNNGATWATIVNNYNGTSGSYNWTIPNINVNQAVVRITDINNAPCMSDKSNAVFNIISTVAVTSPNGGQTLTAGVVQNGGTHNMSSTSVIGSTGNFYDDGGPSGNYFRSRTYTKTFTPDVPNHKMRMVFTAFRTFNSGDYLRVYDGPNTSSPLIGQYSGTSSPGTIVSTHKTGALTFFWRSDNSFNTEQSGWEAYYHTQGPNTTNLNWSITGTSGEFDLEYSTNSGVSWTRIVSSVPSTTGTFDWPVPNTTTTAGRVRVIDHNNNAIVDQSDADFTINAAVPQMVLCEPNGGEVLYAGNNFTIEWNSAFLPGPNVQLEYSTNNGTSWTNIISSTINDGTHTWTIPNTPTTNALVRVSAVGNPAINDVSDAVFTIRPFIEVLSPNGGETLDGCIGRTISWRRGGTSNRYDIDFTTDGGATWTNIITNYSNTSQTPSYSGWIPPNVNATQCRVRVVDNQDPSKRDSSDTFFSLDQETYITVLTPNGGQNYVAGNTVNIVYAVFNGVVNVRLEYSIDSGATWATIVSSTSGGSYNWTIPNIQSNRALIRAYEVGNICKVDVSDATFNILAEVNITTPNGGQNFTAVGGFNGGTYLMNNIPATITTGNFYDDGGENGNYSSSRNYTKVIRPENPSSKLQVVFTSFRTFNSGDYLRIYDGPNTGSPLIGQYSSTSSPGTITSTHKSGALTFNWRSDNSNSQAGWKAYLTSVNPGNENISWTILGTSGLFDLDYSTNGGTTWTRIISDFASSGATATYSWPVPNTPTTQGRVRVTDVNQGLITDMSDSNFTIGGASPVYLACVPNGGEIYYAGQTVTLEWLSSFTTSSFVNLDYSTDNGATWQTILSNTFNDGSESWIVPNEVTSTARFRVSDASNASRFDISDGTFEIRAPIRVIDPNGGQSLTGCSAYNIRWEAGPASSRFNIDLTTDNGATWQRIRTNLSTSSTFPSFNWSPLPNISANNCRIRVLDSLNSSRGDTSDAVFSISPTLNVQLAQPNGGQFWVAGTSQQIIYTTQGGVTNVRIEYSVDSGATWSTIISNTSGGTYNWTIPNISTTRALIRVTDVSTPCNSTTSAATFNLVSEINLATPNGGQTFKATGGLNGGTFLMNSNTDVTLTTGNFYDDGGRTGNYLRSRSYTKTFYPENPTQKLQFVFTAFRTFNSGDYLRVYDGENTAAPLIGQYSSTSSPATVTATNKRGAITFFWRADNSFNSEQSGFQAYITSIDPDNGTIGWSRTGTSNNFHIDYSTNAGISWNRVLSYHPGTSSNFSWPVPNTPTTQGRVRIIDSGNNSIVDQSDSNFTITGADPVYLVCVPNGGEIWYGGETRALNWESAFTASAFVNLDYSTDNGATWISIATNSLNDGAENWLVPNIATTTALFRVSDPSGTIRDTSDATFEIRKAVRVSDPNGGNSLVGCSNYNIRWEAGNSSSLWNIDFSTDNGATWQRIRTGLSNSSTFPSYTWTSLPNISSSQCLVRVLDSLNVSKGDTSDAPFTISPTLNVQITQPNGGQFWVAGTNQAIIYSVQGGVSNVRIQYSVDSGATWATITNNTTNQPYIWNIPNLDSDNALIRITDVNTPCNSATSAAVFSINSEVDLTAPNGGQTFQAKGGLNGGNFLMNTNTEATVTTGNFYDDGGRTGNYQRSRNYIRTFKPENPTQKLRFNFTNFRTFNSGDYLRIFDGPSTSSPLIGTYSSTSNPGIVTSTHKTGALTFNWRSDNSFNSEQAGFEAFFTCVDPGTANPDITWTRSGTSGQYHLDLSYNNGASWNRIVSYLPSNPLSFNWPVPNFPTTQAKIRVLDAQNNSIVDESDSAFTITTADPVYLVCSANGGETWFAGETRTIQWESAFAVSPFVRLEYSIDSGSTWIVINPSALNDGTENWTIPNTPSSTALIRISDPAGNFADSSDAVFEIKPYIRIITPNGGNSFNGCSNTNIQWESGNSSNRWNIELSTDSGATWSRIRTNFFNGSTISSFSWTSLPNLNSSTCLVRVIDSLNTFKQDTSDAVFTINPTLNVQIGQPNGGETWVAGSTYPITYFVQSGITSVHIEYSTNNGTTWSTVTSNTSGGLFNWTIPNVNTSQALIRVTDRNNSCNAATSAATFSLLSQIQVTQPNGGDTLKASAGLAGGTYLMNSNTAVTLNTGNFYDDGGRTGNYARSRNYTKTFHPDNPNHKLQVRFYAFRTFNSGDYLRVYDGPNTSSPLLGTYSSSSSPGTITSTHPTGALTFNWRSDNSFNSEQSGFSAYFVSQGPDNESVNWNIIGTSKTFRLQYSIDGGLVYNTIIDEYPNTTGQFSWPVPNTQTTRARFRVVDFSNGTIVDESDSNFVIGPPDPVLIVDEPNGGEIFFAGTNNTVQWRSAFLTAPTLRVELSIDSGMTWSTITANTGNTGSYTFQTPNTPTTKGKIRVSENGGSNVSAISDGLFTIKPYITVLGPNGGENILGCSSRTISWEHGGTSGRFDIDYSTDGGMTWTQLTTNLSSGGTSGTFTWNVPNLNTSNALVRVRDTNDPTKGDTSNAVFTLSPTFDVQVLSPNGGEIWVTGTVQTIVYSAASGVSGVRIEYSVDSGATWSTLTSNSTGGTFNWTVPNRPSTKALVRVTDRLNSCKFDISNSVFTILSELTVTSPNGGEVWQGNVGDPGGDFLMNSNTAVVCNSGNFMDDGGRTGNYIRSRTYTKTFTPDIPGNKMQFTFHSFRTFNTGDYLRIYDGPNTSSPLIGQYSSSSNPGTVTSTHPSGALTFFWRADNSFNTEREGWYASINTVGTQAQPITWSITGTSGSFNLDYSTNTGLTWDRIVSYLPVNGSFGSWNWQVPNQPTTNALVRVTDASNGAIVDVSNNTFTINEATPLMTSPNGGETAFEGIPFEITWASPTYLTTNVQLEYSTDNGITWNLITAFTFNDGSYLWTPPPTSTPFYDCLVRVSESGNTIKNDVSDAKFTLSPAIRIVSPNSNQGNFRGCTQSTISWVAGASNNYRIELSVDSGSTWTVVESNYINNNSVVNYQWSIPNSPSTNCLVRVTDNNNASRTDVSDSVFTITPTITITQPNFGGQIQAGSNFTIRWNSNVVSNFYDIDYSTNGGSSWINIVTNHFTTTDSYVWTNVPNTVSSNCKVRVRDNLNTCKEGVSEQVFTIQAAAPAITITNPNGGDTLNGCATYNITWNQLTVSNFFNISFSTNGGSSWNTIVNNFFTTGGSYAWTVPNLTSNNCLVRVTDAADPNKTDVSNTAFRIQNAVSASITALPSTSVCLGDTVFLTSSSAVGNSWFPFGQTSQTIAVTQPGNYSVTVNNGSCSATSQTLTVTFNPLPAQPTISTSGSTSICAGDNVVLTSSSPSGNTWSPGGQTTQAISVSSAGTYTVTVANQFGCIATSAPVAVSVNPLPSAPTAGSNTPVGLGNSINLTASTIPGATYSWTGPNGFTSNVQNPSISNATTAMSGTYFVTATVNGCTGPAGSTTVVVNPNSGTTNITGMIRSELGSPIRSTTLYLSGFGADTMTTGSNGLWDFDMSIGENYQVRPHKNNDTVSNNGITTLDLILMRRHILNQDTLNSAYKILAADVDSSNSVTTLDLILTRTVILQTNRTFPNGRLWKFVDSDFVFPNPLMPWTYASTRSYTNVTAGSNQDFVGVKLGDVNNTWDPNVARLSWAGEVGIGLDDVFAPQGGEITVPVTVENFNEVSGIQFTLEWNASQLEYTGVENVSLEAHFGESQVKDGKLAMSWDEENGLTRSLPDGTVLFELKFKVTGNADASSHLYVASSMARAEAYTDDLRLLTLRSAPARVTVSGEVASGESAATPEIQPEEMGYALFQNFPNPFDEQTEISFQVPEAVDVRFVIFDVNGQAVREFEGSYAAGAHSISWNGNDRSGRRVTAGIYYVRMQTDKFTATRKMVFMRP